MLVIKKCMLSQNKFKKKLHSYQMPNSRTKETLKKNAVMF